jgi:hypothetical protein
MDILQVLDLKDITWKELFPGVKTVEVMVAASVIDELGYACTRMSGSPACALCGPTGKLP